jgi:hypothetical protein
MTETCCNSVLLLIMSGCWVRPTNGLSPSISSVAAERPIAFGHHRYEWLYAASLSV